MNHQQSLTYSAMITGTTVATTVRTANLDCQGSDFATIVVTTSAEVNTSSTNLVAAILEADDTDASSFATFDADHQRTIDNTAAAVAAFHIDLRGRKRYLRVSLTPDSNATNGPVIVSAVGILKKQNQGALLATASA